MSAPMSSIRRQKGANRMPITTLVDTVTRLQRGGIGAEATDGGFPHHRCIDVEDQIELNIANQPCGLRELFVELSRTPACITREHAGARRWRCSEDAAED